jgi:heme/copper-type cytochrome/quinol oxidase subunit 2
MRLILNLIKSPVNTHRFLKILVISCFLTLVLRLEAEEASVQVFEIHFEQHHFTPQTLVVPSDRPVVVKVVNSSAERIEFESFKLNREKVIDPGKTVTVNLPPLKAGRYDFFDDFHTDVPEGEIVAQ